MVLKLPAATAIHLVSSRGASLLVMGKRTMREWVVVSYPEADAVLQDRELFEQARAFVASLG